MYDALDSEKGLRQGDIIEKFPVPTLPLAYDVVRIPTGDSVVPTITKASELNDAFASGREDIIVPAAVSTVILLSQSCDAQRRQRLSLARVGPITELSTGLQSDVRRGKVVYLMHLPATDVKLAESYVDLTRMYSFDRSVVELYKGNRIVVMSDFGRHCVGWALSRFFARPAFD